MMMMTTTTMMTDTAVQLRNVGSERHRGPGSFKQKQKFNNLTVLQLT